MGTQMVAGMTALTKAVISMLLWLTAVTHPLSPTLPPREPTIPDLLREAEIRHELPAYLLHAIAYVESRMDHSQVGRHGEVGLLQLHPKHHRTGETLEEHIDIAAAYLAAMIQRFGLDRGIAAYNQGPSNPRAGHYNRRVFQAWEDWVKLCSDSNQWPTRRSGTGF